MNFSSQQHLLHLATFANPCNICYALWHLLHLATFAMGNRAAMGVLGQYVGSKYQYQFLNTITAYVDNFIPSLYLCFKAAAPKYVFCFLHNICFSLSPRSSTKCLLPKWTFSWPNSQDWGRCFRMFRKFFDCTPPQHTVEGCSEFYKLHKHGRWFYLLWNCTS